VPLGFTFSFPVEQTALASGKVLTWTKGFSARNTIGNDVVKLLQDAFDRKHLHVQCVALVNDVGSLAQSMLLAGRSPDLQTVGALLSRAYTAGGCVLGAIFGTGTNGAYLESVSEITKLADRSTDPDAKMVINCEWGAFNNTRTVLPATAYDQKLDRESINPKFQAFEKFISGMYLGEITRNVLIGLVDTPHPLLFGGRGSKALNEHYGLDTATMSAVEEAWQGAAECEAEVRKESEEEAKIATDGTPAAGGPNGDDLEKKLEALEIGGASLTPAVHPTAGVTTTASAATTQSSAPPKLDASVLFGDDMADTLDHLDAPTRARLERVRQVLIKDLGYPADAVSLRDAAVVRFVARLVATRAAALSACAVAAVAVQQKAAHLGPDKNADFKGERLAVGVDGSLIQFYPNFELHLREALRSLVGEPVEKAVEIGMAKDGSGVGGTCRSPLSHWAHVDPMRSGVVRTAGGETVEAEEPIDCMTCACNLDIQPCPMCPNSCDPISRAFIIAQPPIPLLATDLTTASRHPILDHSQNLIVATMFGRVFHLGVDALLIAAFLAGIRRSTGLT
jgi:hexokinase